MENRENKKTKNSIITAIVFMIVLGQRVFMDNRSGLINDFNRELRDALQDASDYESHMYFDQDGHTLTYTIKSNNDFEFDFKNAANVLCSVVIWPWNRVDSIVFIVEMPSGDKEYTFVNEGGLVYEK